jgi:hypothetical protein
MSSDLKCEYCQTLNQATDTKCQTCGRSLVRANPGYRPCPECGSVHSPDGANTCVSCGWNFGTPKRLPDKESPQTEACEHWSELPAHSQRTAMIDMAGILILLAGALGITHALLSSLPGTGSDLMYHYERLLPPGKFLDGVIQDNGVLAVLMFIAGALAMSLSMSVFKRGSYTLALMGAVFGIVAVGFLLGAFFAAVGILLLAVSRREFLAECH